MSHKTKITEKAGFFHTRGRQIGNLQLLIFQIRHGMPFKHSDFFQGTVTVFYELDPFLPPRLPPPHFPLAGPAVPGAVAGEADPVCFKHPKRDC